MYESVTVLDFLDSYSPKSQYNFFIATTTNIPAKPLYNHDTVSVHSNHFYCMEICEKLRRDLAMFTYTYLNVNEC